MIISRPKTSTLFSISLFLILAYGIGIWSAFAVPSSPAFWYLIPAICLSTAVIISIKVLIGYRTVMISGERWKVKKLIGGDIEFQSKDIEWWKVTEIKTGGGPYKELHIHSNEGFNVKVSFQEHTEYQSIYKKVKTKCPTKQVKEPS